MYQLYSFYLFRNFYFCLLLPLKVFVHFHNTFFLFLPYQSFYTRISLVSFIDAAFIECLASWAHIHIHTELTNEEKKRRREEQNGIFTCEHYEWLMLVVIYFFFFSLSRQWLDTNGSKMEVDPALHSPS